MSLMDIFEDALDTARDNLKWVALGIAGVLIVIVVVAVAIRRGGGGAEGNGEVAGRTEEEKSKDITLDLGGGVTMDFVWINQIEGWMGKYEVTNGQFRRFRPEHNSQAYGEHELNGDDQPVVFVNCDDAKQFAKWLSGNTNMPDSYTVRVPGRIEWLAVAQCGDEREFPWGNKWPPPKDWNYHWEDGAGDWSTLNGSKDGFPVTCPVDKSGENTWGVYGMGGNVLEWTSEFDVTSRGGQVLRGGSWGHFTLDTLLCDRRFTTQPTERTHDIGFRVCVVH